MDGSVGGGSLSSSFASSVAHFEFTEPVSTHLALLLKEQGDTNINVSGLRLMKLLIDG